MTSMLHGLVFGVRCHYCSRFRSPKEVINFAGQGGAVMCWRCYEKHQQYLQMLAGSIPPACQECGVSWEQLQISDPQGNTCMYGHVKDGIYQLLCKVCDAEYIRKRVDLYGDTKFGWLKKLKGTK